VYGDKELQISQSVKGGAGSVVGKILIVEKAQKHAIRMVELF